MAIINDIYEGITIIKPTYTVDATYGDSALTGSSVVSTSGYIVLLSTNDEIVKSGVLNTGDARGYFLPADESNLKPGYQIEYQSKKYEIVGEPQKYSIGGTAIHIEATLKRYHTG